jgi:hypothetical protein
MQTQALSTRSMYQISKDHDILMQIVEDNEGEVTPEIEQALALTFENFTEKAASYACIVKHYEDHATVVEKEIDRLKKILEQAKKRKELFKQNLENAMKVFQVEKIDTPLLKLSFRKSEAVEILDEDQVPQEFKDVKITESVSKTKIKDAIKEGKVIPGAQLVTKQNLQIK